MQQKNEKIKKEKKKGPDQRNMERGAGRGRQKVGMPNTLRRSTSFPEKTQEKGPTIPPGSQMELTVRQPITGSQGCIVPPWTVSAVLH